MRNSAFYPHAAPDRYLKCSHTFRYAALPATALSGLSVKFIFCGYCNADETFC